MRKRKAVFFITLLSMLLLIIPQMVFAAAEDRRCCTIDPGDPHSFPATKVPLVVNAPAVPTDVIADGSFENGTPNAYWSESSTNFGTPLCTVADCGNGGGTTGPNTGSWWAWFGGIGSLEEGSLSQAVTIASGADAMLSFQFSIPVCADTADFLEVRVDGNREWVVYADSALCGVIGYSQVDIDLSAYADGNSHLIEFHSISGNNNGTTNLLVDDVELIVTPVDGGLIPTVNEWGMMILTLALGIAAIIRMKKFSPASHKA